MSSTPCPAPSAPQTPGTGTYRTRVPVEAAVALWLQRYATQLEEATRAALAEAPKRQHRDPQDAERRRLTKLIDTEQAKLDRLLDAYTDGALDLAAYKRRRADIEHDVEAARHRLAELDAAPAQEPVAPVVRGFADMWSTLSVEVRRDVAGALLTTVRVRQDKTVEIVPRWGETVMITFTKRGSSAKAIPTEAQMASTDES